MFENSPKTVPVQYEEAVDGVRGYFDLEQFVSYDPNDNDSIDACVKYMEDAIADTTARGIPRQGTPLPTDWMDGRKNLGRLREDAATVRAQLPAQDQGSFRPQFAGRPELSVAARGLGTGSSRVHGRATIRTGNGT